MAMEDERSIERRYDELCELLLRYASRITVISMISVVCKNRGIEQPPQSLQHLERLVEELSPGIRMFCPAHEVPRLMLAIGELLE